MTLAIVLILVVIGSVIFHLLSPWQATPAASNWGSIDDTLLLTVLITGLFFVAISLFVAIAIIRFRHRPGRRAAYEPENRKLEWWLIGITSVGIVAMLAPGLIVYDDFIRVPKNAYPLEVVGQQWQWAFRFAGDDGELGRTDIRWVSADNPLGLDPGDPNGQDDRLIRSNEVRLPLGRPVRVLLRSKDVLHNFYIPQMRAKMDMVPGMVSYLWFEPTRTGSFEILCAEFCGVGHYNMRGKLIVEPVETFEQWLAAQPTFAQLQAGAATPAADPLVEKGRLLAEQNGCLACHSIDGTPSLGPGWLGLYGKTEILADGSTVTVDDAYLIESIVAPNAKLVQGYPPVMVAYPFDSETLDALVAYIRSLSGAEDAVEPDRSAVPVEQGRQLAQTLGCLACHSVDGSPAVGPGWLGLYGSRRTLDDGRELLADDAYLADSIRSPNAAIVRGYSPIMPPYTLSEAQLEAMLAYLRSLAADNAQSSQTEERQGESP